MTDDYERPARRYVGYPVPTASGFGMLDEWNLVNPYEPMHLPTHVPGYPGFAGDPVNLPPANSSLLDDPEPVEMNPTDQRLAAGTQMPPMEPAQKKYERLAGMVSQVPEIEQARAPQLSAPPVWAGGKTLDITPYLRQFGRRAPR